MAPLAPPTPPQLAAQIVSAVWQRVDLDTSDIRGTVRERLAEPSRDYIWARAEEIAMEELRTTRGGELVAQCRRALGLVRNDLVALGADVDAITADLAAHGAASWIAGAVGYQLAFDVAWEVITSDSKVLA